MTTDYDGIAKTLKALAHPIRLEILDMLRRGEVCVCHIETVLGKRQAYISQQLQVLRDSGLVVSRKEGLSVYYRLADSEIEQWLTVICDDMPEANHAILPDCPCPNCVEASV